MIGQAIDKITRKPKNHVVDGDALLVKIDGGGGGGGGDASAANQTALNTAFGTKTDPAVYSGDGSSISMLKAIRDYAGGIGGPADGVASSDTGTGSLVSLFKRLLTFMSKPDPYVLAMGTAGTAGQPRWVSGTTASLAVGATATVIFDLGPDWAKYQPVSVYMGLLATGSATTTTQYYCNESASMTGARRMGPAGWVNGATTLYENITNNQGEQEVMLRPSGRFLIITFTQATAAQTSGSTVKVGARPQY